jgi:RTX calcium-binding nonapeptide repeat (4 copies)
VGSSRATLNPEAVRSEEIPVKARPLCAPIAGALLAPALAAATVAGTPNQNDGLAGTAPYDVGLYTAFCPYGHERHGHRRGRSLISSPAARLAPMARLAPLARLAPVARLANTSEAGWPAKECLKMDKGRAGRRHTIVGLNGVHNWLLGGYGDDTIIGGDHGDVIWGDYHPSGEPRAQTATIHAGDGRNVIYANDTHDYVWTGRNPYTVVHAHASGISGVIHCQSPYIVVYLSTVSERHFKLDGCRRISHYSVGY